MLISVTLCFICIGGVILRAGCYSSLYTCFIVSIPAEGFENSQATGFRVFGLRLLYRSVVVDITGVAAGVALEIAAVVRTDSGAVCLWAAQQLVYI